MSSNFTDMLPPKEGPLSRHCKICSINKNLLRCASCKVAYYCSKDHQAANWLSHKAACLDLKKRRMVLDMERQALGRMQDDPSTSCGNPFHTGIGHFWAIPETRHYMRARFALVEAILKMNTYDAVNAAAEHLLDMCRLSRGDNMSVRDIIPALLIRLGKDQECYDFIKWWKTAGASSNYDWDNMDLPYLDIKNADILEPVEYICDEYFGVSHNVAATLLKIRLLLGVKKALQSTATLSERESLPPEVLNKIQDDLLSGTLGKRWDDMTFAQRSKLVDTLSSQIDKLYKSVNKGNKHFWSGLLKPEPHLKSRPDMYEHGGADQMVLILQYNIEAWRESPGAIEYIEERARKDAGH